MRRLFLAVAYTLLIFAVAPLPSSARSQPDRIADVAPGAPIFTGPAASLPDEPNVLTVAQNQPAEGDTSRIDKLKEALGGDKADSTPAPAPEPTLAVAPDVVSPEILGEAGTESMRAAFKSYYDYRVRGFAHRSDVFAWQLLSSKLIFALVVAIVLLGLYFSWLQFHASYRGNAGHGDTDTTVELGTTGIKITSPVLGVIILTLSLAFFYLYLVNVYPIDEVF
ncbi:MAG: hypothetical protein KDJ77_12985 [Rhodobiaceae bacterium]|nr:hypothetical protein [Rhodobiaceae bacterium]